MANFLYGHRRMKQQFVYAGFILCLVPCASSNSDWTNHLSYENIFSTNNTRYVQIQQRPRPYNIEHVDHIDHISSYDNSKFNINEDTKGNDIEYEGEGEYKEKLLVGFSRDPFRYSIPEDDYLKGVRNMSPNTYSGKGERGKRGVLHLYNMIYCATGCEPLSYKGYGCYCGFLGSGRATDGIDRCCQMHDKCYENIYCPLFTTYFQPYYWKCYHNQPLCALENHQNTDNFINSCAGKLCECDRQFAMCVRRYRCPRRRALCRSSPLRLLQNLLMFK